MSLTVAELMGLLPRPGVRVGRMVRGVGIVPLTSKRRPPRAETAVAKAMLECQRLREGITSEHIVAALGVSLLRASTILARLRDRELVRLTEKKKSAKGGRCLHVWEWVGE